MRRAAWPAARPDAFHPDLARSLWVLANRIDENSDPLSGLAANAEAIAILSAPFLRLPAAFAPRMVGMLQGYFERCDKLERQPDAHLLAPILAALQSLHKDEEKEP
jgi:hypothetical protein